VRDREAEQSQANETPLEPAPGEQPGSLMGPILEANADANRDTYHQ